MTPAPGYWWFQGDAGPTIVWVVETEQGLGFHRFDGEGPRAIADRPANQWIAPVTPPNKVAAMRRKLMTVEAITGQVRIDAVSESHDKVRALQLGDFAAQLMRALGRPE